MKRKIINIDEKLCNGCGDCVVGCAEGAIKIIDGKAKLVREDFCDGFGDCIGTCPTGALTIEEREALDFDEEAVKKNLLETEGHDAVIRMEEAQKKHEGNHKKNQSFSGCPGSRSINLQKNKTNKDQSDQSNEFNRSILPSELEQWPIQLHLINPAGEHFKEKELAILSTCAPVASGDVQWKYIKGRSVVVACPKLDITDPYVDKLARIFSQMNNPKAIVIRMEVPCCGGLSQIAQLALKKAGREDFVLEEHTISLRGDVIGVRKLSSPNQFEV